MTGARLVAHQVRFDQKVFWRDPQAVFFTVALPVLFLVIFVTIFGDDTLDGRAGEVRLATYYVPGIVVLGVISASFASLVISLVELRERGVMKRLRSTPLPTWAFIAGRVATVALLSLLIAVVLQAIGWVAFDVGLEAKAVPAVLVTLFVGTATFCCLGFAVTGLVRTREAAPAITNLIVLPLYFISGVFFPIDQEPDWLQNVADVFPVAHFTQALFGAYVPGDGTGFAWTHLAVVAAWGVGGLLVAVKTFRWYPSRSG